MIRVSIKHIAAVDYLNYNSDAHTYDPESMVETLLPVVKEKLFREIYREVAKQYKTDDILAGIKAMVEVTVLHNHKSKNLWNHFNKEMAIELCDPDRRRVRLHEERSLYEKNLTFSERMLNWAIRMESRDSSAE